MLKLKLLSIFLFLGFMAQSQHLRKPFKGFYFGAEGGYQYISVSASVDDIKLIEDGTTTVVGGFIGWREELDNHFVFGAELQVNQPFGSFASNVNGGQTLITYDLGIQWALQFAMGKDFLRNHIFTYVAANQTSFTMDVTNSEGTLEQKGQRGMALLGIGVERDIAAGFTARMTIGTSIDGVRSTNNGIDAKLGLLFNI